MKTLIAAASAAALLLTVPAWAANGNSLNSQDKQFIKQAGAINLGEVDLGKMAEHKGATPAVREFGRWMVSAHSHGLHRLKTIAEEENAWHSPELTSAQKRLRNELQRASGRQFDRDYTGAMVNGHEKAIKKFKKEASSGQNHKIMTYAKNTLPVLHQHLAEAKILSSGGKRMVYRSTTTAGSGGSRPERAR